MKNSDYSLMMCYLHMKFEQSTCSMQIRDCYKPTLKCRINTKNYYFSVEMNRVSKGTFGHVASSAQGLLSFNIQ